MSAITVHYRVQKLDGEDITASVRFYVRAGNVVKAEVVGSHPDNTPPPGDAPVARAAVQAPTPVPQVIDHFTEPLTAAMHGPSMTLHLDSAFSLSQLEQAKQTARVERKPLGFLMVWGQFFDHEAGPRSRGSDSALVHFYEVFGQQLVLVFVRHETELGLVPRAVMRGFYGRNEGGYAPNMAVTDATATEFIVEIPYRALDGAGRDPLFAEGGKVIDQWMATHPDAMPTPAAPASQ